MLRYTSVTGGGSKLIFHRICLWSSMSSSAFELPRDTTNKRACVPSDDSYQPGHPPSLISLRCALWSSMSSSAFELPRDITNKRACVPSDDAYQPGNPPSLISLRCVLNGRGPSCGQQRLIRLGRCPGWTVYYGRKGHFVRKRLNFNIWTKGGENAEVYNIQQVYFQYLGNN